MNIHSNGHGKYAAYDNEAFDACFPLSGSPPEGESDEVSLREFHKNGSVRAGSWQPGRVGDFTYISLQVIIEIMNTVSSAAGEAWHMALKCKKELDLLFVRDQLHRYTENPEDLPRFHSIHRRSDTCGKFFRFQLTEAPKRGWPRVGGRNFVSEDVQKGKITTASWIMASRAG